MEGTRLALRALIRLSGDDVRGFLQGLVTQDMSQLAPGNPLWAGLLTPQGKCLFEFLLWADGEDVLVDCEAEAAEDLTRRLSMYRLRRQIAIAAEPDLAVHWRATGAPLDPRLPALGARWLAPDDGDDADVAWLAHRLSLGVCEGRNETGDVLWLECNATELEGVSFTKGCYVGQENTARMHHRSKVNRRLMVVRTDELGPRTRVFHRELGLAVEHRRIDDLEGAIVPDWLEEAWRK